MSRALGHVVVISVGDVVSVGVGIVSRALGHVVVISVGFVVSVGVVSEELGRYLPLSRALVVVVVSVSVGVVVVNLDNPPLAVARGRESISQIMKHSIEHVSRWDAAANV